MCPPNCNDHCDAHFGNFDASHDDSTCDRRHVGQTKETIVYCEALRQAKRREMPTVLYL